jgi:nicotinate-nucleotide adenylyltransferase
MVRPAPDYRSLVKHPAIPAAELWRGMRIGLLGGSFNPAHAGHHFISSLALRKLKLDEVWWLVSPQNPLKSRNEMAPLSARMARARKVAGHPRIRVLALEGRMGTRYTADTLEKLNALLPGTKFVWLMGADAFLDLPRWEHWERIFYQAPVAVFGRPSYSLKVTAAKAAHRFAAGRVDEWDAAHLLEEERPAWTFFRSTRHPASSTRIRLEYAARGRRWEDGGV